MSQTFVSIYNYYTTIGVKFFLAVHYAKVTTKLG